MGGPGVLGHRHQHLGRDDGGLPAFARKTDCAALQRRDLLRRQLDPEVTAGDHDPIARVDDRLEALDRFGLLDLRDERHPPAEGLHELAHDDQVVGRAHKRQRHVIHAELQPELEVAAVLVDQRWHRQVRRREVDALARRDLPADDDLAGDIGAIDRRDAELEAAVGEQHRLTDVHVLCESRIGRRQSRPGPEEVAFARDDAGLADG